MKKFVSIAVLYAVLMQLVIISISPMVFANDSIVLLDEIYKGKDYNDDDLGRLGWKVLGSDVGGSFKDTNGTLSVSAQTGIQMVRIGSTISSSNLWYYGVGKDLSVTQPVGDDSHMTVRRNNFKGKYDVELGMRHSRLDGAYNRFQIQLGAVNYDYQFASIRPNGVTYGQNNPAGLNTTYNAYNSRLKATIDTGAGEFQTYYSLAAGTGTPGEPQLLARLADGTDTLATNDDSFINGMMFRFSQQSDVNSFVNVDWFKLTEHRKDNDATDDVLENLSTAVLTDSPDEVKTPIHLPSAAELGVAGAEITWSSSNPSVISSDGLTVDRPAVDTEVIMTAKIVNTEDGFTQYADFSLTVAAAESVVSDVYTVLDYELLTTEESSAITSDVTLPLSMDGYDGVSITWESDSDAIAVDNIAGVGNVTRPTGKTDAEVTLTATITDGVITAYKEFHFTILTSYEPPGPKMIAYELYKGGTYKNEDLSGLGWSKPTATAANGTIHIDPVDGLVITKTQAPGTSNRNVFGVEKKLQASEPVAGDPHMTVRRESFKGIYDVDLDIAINPNSSGYWRFILFNGINEIGASQNILTYRLDNRFMIGSGGGSQFPGASVGPGSIKTRINMDTKKWQMFYNGGTSPQESSQSLTEFTFTQTSYLSSIAFQFDERLPNSVSNFINIESVKLTEIERFDDITDKVIAQLSTETLTSTPDKVATSLNLPTVFPGVSNVSVEWSSSDTSTISSSGIVTPKALNTPVTMTAKITNRNDQFTQYADFALTVTGTSSVAKVYTAIDESMLTTQNPSKITSNLTLPLEIDGYDDVSVTWSSNSSAIAVDNEAGIGNVVRPAGRGDTDAVLTATITDGEVSMKKQFKFTVLTTYIPPAPVVLADWSFLGKTMDQLLNDGLLDLSDKADVSINSEGNLMVKKLSESASGNSAAITQAVGFPVKIYDDGDLSAGERIATYTSKMKGQYQVEYLIKVSGAGTVTDDNAMVVAGINGASARLSSPIGANFMFGYGRANTYIPTAPLYSSSGNYRFSPSPAPLGNYLNKWLRLRFEINMFRPANDQVTISYALGTETEKPGREGLIQLSKPEGGIPFGASSGMGLVEYDFLFTPQLGFHEQLPKGMAVEVANVKITQMEEDTDFVPANVDAALAQLSMESITDNAAAYNQLKNPLPTRVIVSGRNFAVLWSSGNPELVGNDGTFNGTAADVGKNVYLTATVKDGSYEKSKVFRLTMGNPPKEASAPYVTNVNVKGSASAGGVLSVSYTFNDADGYGNNSDITWQASMGSTFYDIPGAVGSSYVVQSNDVGKSIRANVHPKNSKMILGQTVSSNSVYIQGSSGGGGGSGSGSGGSIINVDYSGGTSGDVNHQQNQGIGGAVFSDVPATHWAAVAINALSDKGIVSGIGNGIFNPNAEITREQFAKIITLSFDGLNKDARTDFADVTPEDWSYPYIASLSRHSIILGDGSAFNKSDNITREDMAVIMWRAMDTFGVLVPQVRSMTFSDMSEISEYAMEAVANLTDRGIINGSDGKFRPKDFCSRAEVAKMVYEVYRLRGAY